MSYSVIKTKVPDMANKLMDLGPVADLYPGAQDVLGGEDDLTFCTHASLLYNKEATLGDKWALVQHCDLIDAPLQLYHPSPLSRDFRTTEWTVIVRHKVGLQTCLNFKSCNGNVLT